MCIGSSIVCMLTLAILPSRDAADRAPDVPEGWSIERVAAAPEILYPTAIVVDPEGTVYLGQDPMDMTGPPTEPIDSIVAIRPDGSIETFANELWAVMGLEWADGTLYVVHPPFLSALRDRDGDGRAEERIDLVTGLGPDPPAFNGINDHVPSGVRLGMDGFLYLSIGDKGIPNATARDGSTIRMKGGGVIRVRPDGSDLEIVSTGERNPLSVMLTTTDEIFTYGNDDDSKKWPNSLTHHIVGGHYGYPYEFLTKPSRCLPIVAGQIGGAGAQGICYTGGALPERYTGNLFVCDWGRQTVYRYVVAREGGTFRKVAREPFVTAGDLSDFRPFSIAEAPDGAALYLVDWADNGWLRPDVQSGRLYRLTYVGDDAVEPKPRSEGSDLDALLSTLEHRNHRVRLEAQRALSRRGDEAIGPLAKRLNDAKSATQTRLHALWALDEIASPAALDAIRGATQAEDASVRIQAIRRAGIRADIGLRRVIEQALDDPDAVVRREAAIALGRLGRSEAGPALMAHLDEPDPFVAWSIRQAIRDLEAWNADALLAALADPEYRHNALALTDEAWSPVVADALTRALDRFEDPEIRAAVVENLGSIVFAYPEWDGGWFGTNPLAGRPPRRTERWDPDGMKRVAQGLIRALNDPAASVRRRAIVGLEPAASSFLPLLRQRLAEESDPDNVRLLTRVLGARSDMEAAPLLARIAGDARWPVKTRVAAMEALGGIQSPEALRARFTVVYDPEAPPELIARALPDLARSRSLPPNDLAGFLDHEEAAVRVAALSGLAERPDLPEHLIRRVVSRLDDPDSTVQIAAVATLALIGHEPSVPRIVAMAEELPQSSDRFGAIVRALARMRSPLAVSIYLTALEGPNAQLRDAAESALAALADRREIRRQLEARRTDGSLRSEARQALDRILAEFKPMTEWHVIGPFPRTSTTRFFGEPSIDLARPQPGLNGVRLRWTPMRADLRTGHIDLSELKRIAKRLGGTGYDAANHPDLAAYALAEIPADAEREALLKIHSSGPVWVEWNGAMVFRRDQPAKARSAERLRLPLRSGPNRLLMLVRQAPGGRWDFSASIASLNASAPNQPALAEAARDPADLEALRQFALTRSGDAERGAALFFESEAANCAACHAAGGRGDATIGPDLTGIAANYDREELIRSVLEPSERLATGYQTVLVALEDGKILTGVIREESDEELVLADAEARVWRVPKDRISERRLVETSIMPDDVAQRLDPQAFADLVAFLETLDAPEDAEVEITAAAERRRDQTSNQESPR